MSDSPLTIFDPNNIISYYTFFSPIILITGIVSMSFIFQNWKGIIYLGFILASCLLREFIYSSTNISTQHNDSNSICDSIKYTNYLNYTFSTFVMTFSIMYMAVPMFINNEINFPVFLSMIAYMFIDISVKYKNKCIIDGSQIFFNGLIGAIIATIIVAAMDAGGSSKYLFFNEVSSSKEVCTRPEKQTFKCSVYKNGELIGEAS